MFYFVIISISSLYTTTQTPFFFLSFSFFVRFCIISFFCLIYSSHYLFFLLGLFKVPVSNITYTNWKKQVSIAIPIRSSSIPHVNDILLKSSERHFWLTRKSITIYWFLTSSKSKREMRRIQKRRGACHWV